MSFPLKSGSPERTQKPQSQVQLRLSKRLNAVFTEPQCLLSTASAEPGQQPGPAQLALSLVKHQRALTGFGQNAVAIMKAAF